MRPSTYGMPILKAHFSFQLTSHIQTMSDLPNNNDAIKKCSDSDLRILTNYIHMHLKDKKRKDGTTKFNRSMLDLLLRVTQCQKEVIDWNFNHEREFLEDQFCQRSNFLLVAYGLVVTAAASTSDKSTRITVLILGCIITIILGRTLYRVYKQVDRILTILHQISEHPIKFINESVLHPDKQFGYNSFNGNGLIGFILPAVCAGSLIVWLALAAGGFVGPENANAPTSDECKPSKDNAAIRSDQTETPPIRVNINIIFKIVEKKTENQPEQDKIPSKTEEVKIKDDAPSPTKNPESEASKKEPLNPNGTIKER